MSRIPESAMPHVRPSDTESAQESGGSGRFGQVAELAREYPKTAIAAGAVAAGVVAAAAIPAIRNRVSGGGSKE